MNTSNFNSSYKTVYPWLTDLTQKSNLKLEIISNQQIINEYNTMTYLLLNIINKQKTNESLSSNFDNNPFINGIHSDFGSQIHNQLGKINKIQQENLELKEKIIKQNSQNKEFQSQIQLLKTEIGIINDDKKREDCELEKENDKLVENLERLTKEIDIVQLNIDLKEEQIEKDGFKQKTGVLIGLIEEERRINQESEVLNCINLSKEVIPLEVEQIKSFGWLSKKNRMFEKENMNKGIFDTIKNDFNLSCSNDLNHMRVEGLSSGFKNK